MAMFVVRVFVFIYNSNQVLFNFLKSLLLGDPPPPPTTTTASCFSLNSFVKMADFSQKKITELKSGDLVLSIDSYGNIEQSEVITIMQYGVRLGKINSKI
jgi:hypothetical protein